MHLRYLHIVGFLIMLLAAVFITYPFVFHLGTWSTGTGDELLLSWINTWVVHSLATNPLQLFNAPGFYPFHNTLAYSDLLITSSLLFAVPALLLGQPIAFVNLDLFFSLVFLGFSVYLLGFYFTRTWLFSILAGFLTIFSPVVLDKYVHLQVLFIFFVPLSILSYFHFLKTQKTKFLILTIFFFVSQTYNSFLPGYFIFFCIIIITFCYYFEKKRQARWVLSRKNILVILLGLIFVIPITLPYFSVSREFNYSRDIRDSIHLAIQPEDLLYSYQFTRLKSFFSWLQHPETYPVSVSFKNGFPGIVLSILIFTSFALSLKQWRKMKYQTKSLIVIAITGLLLSFGPFLHLARHTIHHPFPIPLPYALFYYVIPGFNGMRNAARWEMLFIIAMSVISVITLQQLLKSLSSREKIVICLLLLLGVIGEYKSSFIFIPITQTANFPEEYHWLNTIPKDAVVIEMPIYNWDTFPYAAKELERQYYMTANFRRSVNGASGFSPPPWQDMVVPLLRDFPREASLLQLKAVGVDYLVVHTDDYDRLHHDGFQIENTKIPSGDVVLQLLDRSRLVDKQKVFQNTTIYRIN